MLRLVTAQECSGAATVAKHPGHVLVTRDALCPLTPDACHQSPFTGAREMARGASLTFQHPHRRSAQRAANSSIPSQAKVFMNHC